MFTWLFGKPKPKSPGPKNKSPSPVPKLPNNKKTWPLIHPRFFKQYNNTGHCQPLCYKNTGKQIVFDHVLTRREPAKGEYLFVIRASEPTKIYYFSADLDILMNAAMSCETKKPKVIHHDCLGRNQKVICAGTLIFHGYRRVTLINNSGHYLPKAECLHYTSDILKKRLGYRIADFNYF